MLTCGESFQWDLPLIMDAEGDQISSVSVKLAQSWLKFDDSSMKFSFDGAAAKESNAGQYNIPITLTDNYGASTTIKQTIIVIYVPPKEEIVNKDLASAKNETATVETETVETAIDAKNNTEAQPAEQ